MLTQTEKNFSTLLQKFLNLFSALAANHKSRANDEICEFTEMDSAAGMRVAESSRIIIEDEEVNSVKTFEKGEIIVSLEGKFIKSVEENLHNSNEEENNRSLGSIEEPDVLECWEEEKVESKSAANDELALKEESIMDGDGGFSTTNLQNHVRKYYCFTQNSGTNVEDDSSDTGISNESQLSNDSSISIPGRPDRKIENIFIQEPVILSTVEEIRMRCMNTPIEEALEARENFFTENLIFRRLFGRDGSVSKFKTVCCNLQ